MTYDLSNIDQLNRTEPSYLAAYGLTEAPFSQQHDDRFLFLTTALTAQLELLKHYTQYGNLLLIVKGERGIGKSSLKLRFIDTAQEEWQICEIQADTMMDAGQLLRQIATGFGITEPPRDPSVLFEVLSSQLEYLHNESYEPILIIDDAHVLPQDALQSLLYLAEHHSEQQTALRIILFCEPEIETMLEAPSIHSLKERVTHSIDLPRLDEIQTAEYLRHRLAVSGFDGSSPFTPALIHKIFSASAGVPSKINDAAHQILLDDGEPDIEEEEIDLAGEPIPAATLFTLRNTLLGGIAIAIVIFGLLFQDNINSLFEEPKNIVADAVPNKANDLADKILRTETESEAVTKAINTEKSIELTLNKEPEGEDELSNTKEIKTDTTPAIVDQPLPEKINDAAVDPVKPLLQLSSVNPSPVPASKQRQIISISGTGFHKRQQVKVSWKGKEKVLTENQVTIASDSYMSLILNVGMQTDTWTVIVTDPLLKIKSNAISFNVVTNEAKETITKTMVQNKTEAKKDEGLYDQSWIKQQNKNHFTLQLLVTHQKTTAENYLKQFSLHKDAAIFNVQRQGQDWFTLIYDSYPTKSAAQAAAKNLPKGVAKPWVRSFASIAPFLNKQNSVKQTKTKVAVISTDNIQENQDGWLWSQNPRNYTLQLAAGSNKKAIQAFIKRHQLSGKAVYFHRLRNGKDWYILVYGSFDGHSKAIEAIKQLPLSVQKAKPWPRSFSAVHAELN